MIKIDIKDDFSKIVEKFWQFLLFDLYRLSIDVKGVVMEQDYSREDGLEEGGLSASAIYDILLCSNLSIEWAKKE